MYAKRESAPSKYALIIAEIIKTTRVLTINSFGVGHDMFLKVIMRFAKISAIFPLLNVNFIFFIILYYKTYRPTLTRTENDGFGDRCFTIKLWASKLFNLNLVMCCVLFTCFVITKL